MGYTGGMDDDVVLARKLASILPQLNERQRRAVLAAGGRLVEPAIRPRSRSPTKHLPLST